MPTVLAATKPAYPSPWRQLVRRGLASALPRRLFFTRAPANDSICLTFDDGPHPEYTPALLDTLKQHGAPATFFVVGQQVKRYPDLVRRMAAEGHAVGHHSYSHGVPAETSARQLLDELRRTQDLLTPLLGEAPRLFRPPHGKVTLAKLWGLWRAGQTVVLWNVEPKDYARASADEVRAWFDEHPLRGGDVVVMHDNRPQGVAAVAHIIASARCRGLGLTTVASWLG